jgi:hypothetical protein
MMDDIYVFGGYSRSKGDLDDLWMFDRVEEKWIELTLDGTKPPKRSGATLLSPEGNDGMSLLLFGGNGFNDIWEYNVDDDAWMLVQENTDSVTSFGTVLMLPWRALFLLFVFAIYLL